MFLVLELSLLLAVVHFFYFIFVYSHEDYRKLFAFAAVIGHPAHFLPLIIIYIVSPTRLPHSSLSQLYCLPLSFSLSLTRHSPLSLSRDPLTLDSSTLSHLPRFVVNLIHSVVKQPRPIVLVPLPLARHPLSLIVEEPTPSQYLWHSRHHPPHGVPSVAFRGGGL